MRSFANSHALAAVAILLPAALLAADTKFHDAPASAQAAKNPYAGQEEAAQAGKKLYARNCLSCHGPAGKGAGLVPSLVDGRLDSVTPGEVLWFITRGNKDNGMPAWVSLPAKQRWQIVTYVKSMGTSPAAQEASAPPPDINAFQLKAPAPTPPFTDFRYERPGTFHHGERSTPTLCDQIGVQVSTPGFPAGKRVASGTHRIQGGVVWGWVRQPPDLAHGSKRRHFSHGNRSRTHPCVSRANRQRQARAVRDLRQWP
jgi:mono/diheme cytochrome c family protein